MTYIQYKLITISMSPHIINLFKIVKVNVHYTGIFFFPKSLKRMIKHLNKGHTIRKTRIRILIGKLSYLVLPSLYLPVFYIKFFLRGIYLAVYIIEVA